MKTLKDKILQWIKSFITKQWKPLIVKFLRKIFKTLEENEEKIIEKIVPGADAPENISPEAVTPEVLTTAENAERDEKLMGPLKAQKEFPKNSAEVVADTNSASIESEKSVIKNKPVDNLSSVNTSKSSKKKKRKQ